MRLQTLPSFYFTVSTSIDTIAKKQGQIILSKDEQVLFIDVSASQRIRLDCVVHVESNDYLPLAPLDKIYVDDTNKDLYIYIDDDWVKFQSQDNVTIDVVKDETVYNTHTIEAGNGIDVEEDAETGNIVLSVSLTDYYLEFTSSDLNAGGILTLTNARVGSFVILDNTGKLVIPAMTQVGTSVQINLYDWTVTGTWQVFFPLGAAASASSINDIVDIILSSTYVNSTSTVPELDVEAGKVYTFSNPLTSLTLTSVEDGHKPTEIRFVAKANFVFTYETGEGGILGIIGTEPTYTAGSRYHIIIRDGYMEVKPVTVFTSSSQEEPSSEPLVSPFVSVSEQSAYLAAMGGTDYFKVNDGEAYCAFIVYQNDSGVYGRPVLISTSADAVVTDPSTSETPVQVTVNGTTWYAVGFEDGTEWIWGEYFVPGNYCGAKFVGNADPQAASPVWQLGNNGSNKATVVEHLVRIHLELEAAIVEESNDGSDPSEDIEEEEPEP